MTRNTTTIKTLACITLTAAMSLAMYSAAAEKTAAQGAKQITVEAARPGRSSIDGAPLNVVKAQRVVDYSDISLTTPSAAKVLETRIRAAAKAACDELDEKYPTRSPTSTNCLNNATEGGMADARAAIKTAQLEAPAGQMVAIPAIRAIEEVTVEGVRGRRSASGAPIQDVTAARVVNYTDISLTTKSGVTVLENRIREAARSACQELEQKYPVAVEGDSTQSCFKNAVDSAMVVARRAVDAAKLAAATN